LLLALTGPAAAQDPASVVPAFRQLNEAAIAIYQDAKNRFLDQATLSSSPAFDGILIRHHRTEGGSARPSRQSAAENHRPRTAQPVGRRIRPASRGAGSLGGLARTKLAEPSLAHRDRDGRTVRKPACPQLRASAAEHTLAQLVTVAMRERSSASLPRQASERSSPSLAGTDRVPTGCAVRGRWFSAADWREGSGLPFLSVRWWPDQIPSKPAMDTRVRLGSEKAILASCVDRDSRLVE